MSPPTLNAQVTALAHGGEIIASPLSDHPDQRKIFFRKAIPGEIVRVQILEEHKNFRRGSLLEIVESSPERVLPPCTYFERCGGCDYQYMPIALQRRLKREMVESMLLRQARAAPEQGVALLGEDLPAYEYRKRIGLHISPSAGPKPAQIGFYREGSGEVVDIGVCLIASPKLNCALQQARSILSHLESAFAGLVIEESAGDIFVAAKLREDALERVDHQDSAAIKFLGETFPNCCVLDRETPIYSQHQGIPESAAERTFPVGRFSQVNDEGNDLLKSKVLSLVNHPEVTDLYAGAGNFSIPLALAGRSVEAVELDHELVRLGKLSSFKSGIPEHRLRFIESSCEQYLSSHRLKGCVVLDPPRSGADAVAKAISPKLTRQIVYVSCALPTLCRDAKTLLAKGYRLRQTWVVDMFAQTHHVETISLFEA